MNMNIDDWIKLSPDRTETCETHGTYQSKNVFGQIWTQCPRCDQIASEAEKALHEEKSRAKEFEVWQQKISNSGIPLRFQNRALSSFTANTPAQRYALEFSTRYADAFDEVLKTGRCALFVGKPGTGKTHLAAGIGLRIMRQHNRRVLFTTVMRAIRGIKSTWRNGSDETENEAIAHLVLPDLLILDEVGVQYGSETEGLILFDILNERYENRRPTLLLSNLGLDEVRKYLGVRVFDRLREDGGEAVPFDWESHRGQITKTGV
ncbi:ATP-binding protein [Ferrovum myxofaciens]|uniref:ATP-binding protein n=1 Tax=Ferrovum myxofaciens TaxID=416213 RepID=A0A9E6SYC9_9PROT|nr:ATP-binding protein [Ferrovum myxofaciens]QKE37427.1 MAG: ATP-binding protein [Ferrovum myxofaciens]QWY75075.1 MAG: ATP-binding protein [Ferrovum myxofaciens]QWY77811.1 MAG: ATP-binding protein [Ferrovum myxofaciens]